MLSVQLTSKIFSAIAAYIGLFYAGVVGAIMAVLVFTASNVLAYSQSTKVETHTFDYQYKVRVAGTVHFTAGRNKTYWKIYNTATSLTNWDLKSFNYGFSSSNYEMVKTGIDLYLEAS